MVRAATTVPVSQVRNVAIPERSPTSAPGMPSEKAVSAATSSAKSSASSARTPSCTQVRPPEPISV